MKTWTIISCLLLVILFGCEPHKVEKFDFMEIRLHRWTALEGGETFLLRRLGNEWSGKLIGDGDRFSCFYQREVKPANGDWNQFYGSILQAGLLELSGKEPDIGWEDGDGYDLEVTIKDKVNKYSVFLPTKQKSTNSKNILAIGNIIANTFDTPVFVAEYDRRAVGNYLIDICKEFGKNG